MKITSNKIKIIVIFSVVFCVYMFIKDDWITEPVIKKAIKMDKPGKDVIWCKVEKVTGFDWWVVAGDEGRYCNIVGADPIIEASLKYDFEIADNIYIFYIGGKREYFSKEINEEILEYTVTGWDILYPVKRDPLTDIYKSSKYILKSDTQN
jgi:hypothetical protein